MMDYPRENYFLNPILEKTLEFRVTFCSVQKKHKQVAFSSTNLKPINH